MGKIEDEEKDNKKETWDADKVQRYQRNLRDFTVTVRFVLTRM